MEKDDNTFYILRIRGYNDEYDTEKGAREALSNFDVDEPFELTKAVEKVIDFRN